MQNTLFKMSKQITNTNKNKKQIQQDVQYLLTTIRARQNGLIFFLERFSIENHSPQEYRIYKGQFLEKQKIYSSQIAKVISKYNNGVDSNIQKNIRTFWIKVKSIIKVSLDRLHILNLLNQKIFERYEEIINLINKNYDQVLGLGEFLFIENLLKKRNVDALSYGRSQFTTHNSQNKINKNHSDSAFKQLKFSPSIQKDEKSNYSPLKIEHESQQKPIVPPRLKSLNRYKAKKLLLQEKVVTVKGSEKQNKKFNKFVDKLKKNLDGAMDFTLDVNYEKKKTRIQNSQAIYENLFKKNIPQHKTISKFLFYVYGSDNFLEHRLKRIKRPNMKTQKEKTKDLGKLKGKKNDRPQSSQPKKNTKEQQMIQTLLFQKKGKIKRRAFCPNKIAKFIKVF